MVVFLDNLQNEIYHLKNSLVQSFHLLKTNANLGSRDFGKAGDPEQFNAGEEKVKPSRRSINPKQPWGTGGDTALGDGWGHCTR